MWSEHLYVEWAEEVRQETSVSFSFHSSSYFLLCRQQWPQGCFLRQPTPRCAYTSVCLCIYKWAFEGCAQPPAPVALLAGLLWCEQPAPHFELHWSELLYHLFPPWRAETLSQNPPSFPQVSVSYCHSNVTVINTVNGEFLLPDFKIVGTRLGL